MCALDDGCGDKTKYKVQRFAALKINFYVMNYDAKGIGKGKMGWEKFTILSGTTILFGLVKRNGPQTAPKSVKKKMMSMEQIRKYVPNKWKKI